MALGREIMAIAPTNSSGFVHVVVANFPMEKHVLVRTIVMVTCLLAMLGAVSVILSYACVRSLRSQARQILLNLSLMDFGIGAANFTGAAVNFDQYYNDTTGYLNSHNSLIVDNLCKAQAFVALLTTFSSVFWTISLAVYIYLLVFQNWQKMKLYLPVCYILCYGIPIGLTVWLLLTDRLGHAPYDSSGWCSLRIIWQNKWVDLIAATFGYDLWIYLAFVICSTVYLALFLRMNVEFQNAIQLVGIKKFWKSALEFVNVKLVLIPIAFFLLRVWSCIMNIVFVYCKVDPNSLPQELSQFLVIVAGIGDSGQGLANGLIFVFLTGSVRQKLFSLNNCKNCFASAKSSSIDEQGHLLSSEKLDEEARRQSPASVVTPTSSLQI